ncbi:TPA: hypothetical protein ACH3X1_013714 [Trebouxia sp. C0004]
MTLGKWVKSLRLARFDFVQEEHVSGSKSKEGLEAGISQPLQGGSQDSGTSTPRHDVPPSTQQVLLVDALKCPCLISWLCLSKDHLMMLG